jgi:3-hydroxybutyryl-CoA dehydratase
MDAARMKSKTTNAAVRPEMLKWEDVAVGQSLGPVRHHVSERMIRDYAASTGDKHQWHAGGAPPFEGTVAHPAMVTIFSTRLMGRSGIDRPSGGIHAKHEYEFLGIVRAGQTLTTTGRIVEKYSRRERKYVVCESLTEDETGRPVARCRYTQAMAE